MPQILENLSDFQLIRSKAIEIGSFATSRQIARADFILITPENEAFENQLHHFFMLLVAVEFQNGSDAQAVKAEIVAALAEGIDPLSVLAAKHLEVLENLKLDQDALSFIQQLSLVDITSLASQAESRLSEGLPKYLKEALASLYI